MALPHREQRHQYLRMLMEHRDDGGVVLFTSQAWERVFETRGLLVRELVLEFLSTLRFGEVLLDLDAPGTIQFQLGGARRRLDVGSINIPYLLARYLRRFAAGRKSGALIPRGQFVAQLAKHFGLLTEERLWGLTVTALTLPVIDMVELVRLQICEEIDDTRAWVALGPESQPNAAVGAPGAVEDDLVVDEGDQAVPAPIRAPPPPPAVARTMPQRMARLEEDMHEIRGALVEQREVIGAMARDFSKFTVWVRQKGYKGQREAKTVKNRQETGKDKVKSEE
ncbi:hypothetical protein Tco_0206028, partial [Tanacetum coccineum]